MGALNPTVHSSWVPTKWSLDALVEREAPRPFTSRINDRSDEVTGEPMQTLDIPEVVEVASSPTGDNGEVVDVTPPATNQTLTIDQYPHVSILFRNDYKFQVALRESTWPKMMGRALKKNMEEYGLALETSLSGDSLRNIAGSITDAELLLLVAYKIAQNWGDSNLHCLVSGNQMTQILSDDRFSELTFVGDGGAPVVTGKLKACYGYEMLTSSLVRRRSISSTTRTINMAWVGNVPGGGAFVKGVQQDIKFDKETEGLAHRVIASHLFGEALVVNSLAYAMRTTDS